MKTYCLAFLSLVATVPAQSNAQIGMDIELFTLNALVRVATSGSDSAYAMSTTSRNSGTLAAEWFGPMNPAHPMIGFMIARESGDRFEQISDYSWVKHGFYSTNTGCPQAGGNFIYPNCTDTYGVGNNSDTYYLGPPQEIDPWLGGWNPQGSYFDRGDPDVGSPLNFDGQRSLSRSQASALGSFVHRVVVPSADLQAANTRYFYGSYYVVAKEPEANRENNMAHWEVTIDSGGSATHVGTQMQGTILQRWNGARLESGRNEVSGTARDGRFWVGVKVVSLPSGMYRYEYAVHNRDNYSGSTRFEIPVCAGAAVSNAGFKDVDRDSSNDWTFSRQGDRLVWDDTSGSNAQPWNSIYNFWFDCDTPPIDGTLQIFQADPTGRAPTVDIVTSTPTAAPLPVAFGAGCGTPAPVLTATDRPNVPNPNFALEVSSVGPGSDVLIVMSGLQGNLPFLGCTFLLTGEVPIVSSLADLSGVARFPLGIRNEPTLNGLTLHFQAYVLDSLGGTVFGLLDLSNGLTVQVGC